MNKQSHIDLRKSVSGGSGTNGLSAYQVAVANGFVGTEVEWLASLKGADGIQGMQGIAGTNGTNGTNGYTPIKGIDYFDGATGQQGIQGIQGVKGDTGTAGANGTNGVGVPVGGTTGQVLSKIDGTDYNTQWVTSSSGTSDHGLLTGLADDDHTQYHTDARGDARYSLLGHTHSYEPLITKTAGYAKWNGTSWTFANETYSLSSHTHSGVYEPVDATILRSANIGSTVQGYSTNLAGWSGISTSSKQDTLVSGTNIKTINGSSILGSGDLVVSGGGGLSAQVAMMTSTQASTVTGLANVTQLALAMVANGVYQIECFVTFQSAATTTGLNLGLTTPTGCVNMVEIVVPIASTAVASALRTTFPNAAVATNAGNVLGTGVTAINSNHTARISGIIRNGATAGNCQIQFASEVSASAITLQIGSELQLIKIA